LGIKDDLVELGGIPYPLVNQVYRACDFYVSPSYVETFAHPLVEAMACGLPVVAADLEVHREIAGDAAVYFPSPSPEALAECVVDLARRPDLREQQAANGLRRSCEFSWKKHVAEIVKVAKELSEKPILADLGS
jgi:glycosyltransferase involved in cell wall biosynthesis